MSRLGSAIPDDSIAIAGAGIIGLSIAWKLSQRGWRVTVFDKGEIGREASWAGAGMLSLGGEVDQPSRFATLAVESRRQYPSFIRELESVSDRVIDYQECGALDLAYSADELVRLEVRAVAQTRLGIESRAVTTKQIQTFWPRVGSEDLAGGRFFPADAIVDPRDVTAALQRACARAGAKLLPKCAVLAATVTKDEVEVQAESGEERFQAMVIAAGAWSSSIPIAGIPPIPAAEPVRGHLVGFRQPEQTCNTILRHAHTYLLQRANGLLIAGASVERVGFDRLINPEIVAWLASEAGRVLPHLNETAPAEAWIGFRPGSSDLQIGSWHSRRLFLAYGHFRNGILLAPITASLVTDDINANLRTR
ncbi:MAG: glycine oxidase ThiO [Acidobacteriaceae bacterium]|nr:glycine oxidase ThiO [Acidobacteriaceae bacterium]MBV9503265.1 glycine oxidase ThiO [Acidobacteriaceae bacterium]